MTMLFQLQILLGDTGSLTIEVFIAVHSHYYLEKELLIPFVFVGIFFAESIVSNAAKWGISNTPKRDLEEGRAYFLMLAYITIYQKKGISPKVKICDPLLDCGILIGNCLP